LNDQQFVPGGINPGPHIKRACDRSIEKSGDDYMADPLLLKCWVHSATPTIETYEAFQFAFDFFNEGLFEGKLKACLITLQRRSKRTCGYYSAQRFSEIKGKAYTDEIAMNPQRFTSASVGDVLSSLLHEMVHLWQFHFGTPSRGGYHNSEWGSKMKEVGLYPSSTGAVGGRETGQQVSHYIIDGGAFDKACRNLLVAEFTLRWGEVIRVVSENGTEDVAKKNKSNRYKYCCPVCGAAAWGKPDLNLVCGDCKITMGSGE
jgi:predicted SprT family Zn-dependent metalloprotease